jgi:glycosyltransferase involved in cell wall biosynthesis
VPKIGTVIWTPRDAGSGARCGVAQYTAELAAALRDVDRPVAVTPEPDLDGAALVHLQHEHSLVTPEVVAAAAGRGVPLVVTEHTVRREVHAFEAGVEGGAAALVAHSAEGVALLRGRWPALRVEHIPHGCPTWFPPRRSGRGRVIGTFGFLEPHKGLARLLDAAAVLGDVEIVMYGANRVPGGDAWWERVPPTSVGHRVPVRRESAFLEAREVARRLAAEADVLAFPYEEPRFAAVSGAVRVGLASGVPVLTSPTRWFADVTEATLQTDDLVAGLGRLLDDTALRDRLVAGAREHCHAHSWTHTARRHAALYDSLTA